MGKQLSREERRSLLLAARATLYLTYMDMKGAPPHPTAMRLNRKDTLDLVNRLRAVRDGTGWPPA